MTIMLGRTRKHWWGIVLDVPDPLAAARFYAALMDWQIVVSEPDNAVIAPGGDHVEYISFQRATDYVAPTWPAEPGQQQMMLHIDIEVPDLPQAVTQALAAGATLATHQPQQTVRVLKDPAGHPFCLYVDPKTT
jgi:catechol 2,3-dioxygenase-like lactoylglutathione lyase family enzyme